MELKEAIALIRKGKIVFDGGKSMKYFLFMGRYQNEKLYFVHDKTITEDKMKIAELEYNYPDLLAKGWWENKWKIWEGALE